MPSSSSSPLSTPLHSPSPLPPCPLLDLMHNDDALRAALLWTRTSDQVSLRLTCRRIREILDSPAFRLQRCQGGFAEVKAVLPKSRRTSRQTIGSVRHTDATATVVVDGRNVGSASYDIVTRRRGNHLQQGQVTFHSIANAVSHELMTVAANLFDSRGRPRLQSIQQALGPNDTKTPFLYISYFRFYDPLYRNISWIGANALRSLLVETSLKDQWSLVAYIPDAETHFTNEDRAEEERYVRNLRRDDDDDDDDGTKIVDEEKQNEQTHVKNVVCR